MPATIALSSMLLLTVVSFKQRALWGWLGLTFVVVLAMSGWLKWQVETVEKWRLAELLWLYGLRLVLMAMLVLPDAISVTFANRFGALSPVLSAVMA